MADFSPQSQWLRPDLFEEGEEKVVTIKSMAEQEVGPTQEMKWVLSFKEVDKRLILGKGMLKNLALALETSDSDAVVGKRIVLYVDPEVRNPSTNTTGPAVRIRAKAPKVGKPAPKPAATETDSDLGFA